MELKERILGFIASCSEPQAPEVEDGVMGLQNMILSLVGSVRIELNDRSLSWYKSEAMTLPFYSSSRVSWLFPRK